MTALIQHVVSFVPVNESEIIYELKEEDFHFLVETDSYDTIAQNETIDLDSLLPKIVSHARIENFFSVPTNFFNKKMDLYKITRLPLFVDETKALYTANLPRYLALGDDGGSSEWSDDVKRRCTVDEKSRYTFCTIPLPIFSSIQHPCLRSIVLNNSTKDCLKETVELSSPHVVTFAPNIHVISVHTSLQCFEKDDKRHENEFSNITKVGIIKTRCNSFISCGTLDFSSVGSACDNVESYIFSFNSSTANPFRLDKSVNPVDIVMDNLSPMMDIPSLIKSALSHKKHLEDAHIEFESNIHRTIRTKLWAKVLIGMFALVSTVTILTFIFVSRNCLNRICCAINWKEKTDCIFRVCLNKKDFRADDSTVKIRVHDSTLPERDVCYDFLPQNRESADQVQPLSIEMTYHNSLDCSLNSNNSIKNTPAFKSNVASDYLPLVAHTPAPINPLNIVTPKVIRKKTNSLQRKIYECVPESFEISSNFSSITSRDSFEENHDTEN